MSLQGDDGRPTDYTRLKSLQMAKQKEGGVCELCEREVGRLTGHHLVPKARGGKHGPQVLLCPTCHRQLHALFSEATLEKDLSTVEALKQRPQVSSFLAWMRKQKGPASFRVRRAKGRI